MAPCCGLGTLTPNAAIQIQFRVRVRECVNPLINRAVALTPSNTWVEAKTQTTINCQPVTPAIELTKGVVAPGLESTQLSSGAILPGQSAAYHLRLNATDGLSHTVHVSDSLPVGLVATAVTATSGGANHRRCRPDCRVGWLRSAQQRRR